jgi:hypothetical protein
MITDYTLEQIAGVRWRNLNVLHCEGLKGIMLLGQTSEGKSFWQMCGLEEGQPLTRIAAKLVIALDSLRMKAVRHADETLPISDDEFFNIKIKVEDGVIAFILPDSMR